MPEQLTDAELSERVAGILGHEVQLKSHQYALGPKLSDGTRKLYDYATSLDKCREVIAEVERRGLWGEFSVHLHFMTECEISRKPELLDASQGMRDALLATPRQICEAFIAALEGK